MLTIAAFIGGVFSGVVGTLAVALHLKKKLNAQAKEEATKLQQQRAAEALKKLETALQQFQTESKAADNRLSVSDRLRQAAEITLKQSQLNPKLGDEHQLQYNNLELEKLSLLQSILKDGYDPAISVRLGNQDQQMALSTYVASIQKNLN